MSCKKAIGIAKEMKSIFGEKIRLNIFTTDSEEARQYDFRSSTNVLLDGDLTPLEIALNKQKMKDFLSEKLS
jgi:hypothetical protein